ncbi:MAG: multicopper oxidase family protein [Syntrophobacteraceae bacterium]
MRQLSRMTSLALMSVVLAASVQPVPAQQTQVLMPGNTIPKFVDPLPVGGAGGITVVDATQPNSNPQIYMMEFDSQILPSNFSGPSKVWGYRTPADVNDPNRQSYIGPVIVAKRNEQVNMTYRNDLFIAPPSALQPLMPFDLTTEWANPQNIVCQKDVFGNVLQPPLSNVNDPGCYSLPSYTGPLPTVAHFHGGEIPAISDGGPDAWFTLGGALKGGGAPPYVAGTGVTVNYPNRQEPSTLWFHDHALGITRFGVFAGMAGMYILKDDPNEPANLPAGDQDIPLVIQDKSFDLAGQIFYNLASNPQPNPLVHPFWIPEFLGDAIVVNGKTWPFLNVAPRKYRFRILNGSQARFYDLRFSDGRLFDVIATDGGYLQTPVNTNKLVVAPGERYQIVVDFTSAAGTTIVLKNTARTPYPAGAPADQQTVGQILQLRVTGTPVTDPAVPNPLRPVNLPYFDLTAPGAIPATAIHRQLTLNEIASPLGPLQLALNNTVYNQTVSGFTDRNTEKPAVGDTEIWEIINISADAHPIHIHLIQFQILNRQPFNAKGYQAAYGLPVPGEGPPFDYLTPNTDGAIGGNPAVGPFLSSKKPKPPEPYEKGWKDTAIMMPGEVTRVAVRWAPQDAPTVVTAGAVPCTPNVFDATPPCIPSAGNNLFDFDPTTLVNGVGYVWHCHILEHEDNEMMRPYVVGTVPQFPPLP